MVLHNSVKCQDKCGTAFLIQFFWQYFQVVQHFSWQGANLSAVHTFIFSVKLLLKFRDRTGDGPIFRSTEQKYNSPIRRVSNRIIAATVLWFITGDYFLTRHCIFYEKVRSAALYDVYLQDPTVKKDCLPTSVLGLNLNTLLTMSGHRTF